MIVCLSREDAGDGRGQPRPGVVLRCQQLPATRRYLVVLGAAVVFRNSPVRANRAVELEPVEGRIQRSFLDLQYLVRKQVDGLRDGVAVQPAALKRVEDEEVECALQKGWCIGFAHESVLQSLASYDGLG
jgi:hypothetical protein